MAVVNWPITISQQRSRWNAVDGHPGIRLRSQWDAVHNYSRARAVERIGTQVFIHISVTNPGNYRGNDAHAQAIERIGRSRFGTSSSNTGISYNFGIMPNASLYEMQPVGRRGAHTVNDHRRSTCTRWGSQCPGYKQSLVAPSWNNNYTARAFVICQNVNDDVTDAQIDKLARAIVCSYRAGFITRHAAHHPHGHRCLSSKSCPGNKMWARMGDLHTKIHHYLDHGLTADQEPKEDDDMQADEREALMYIRKTLANGTEGRIKHPHNDGSSSIFYGVQETWEDTYALRSVPDELEALRAGILGASADEIKALIETKHAEATQQRQVIAETMTAKLDAVVEATKGSDPAEAKLAAILEILGMAE